MTDRLKAAFIGIPAAAEDNYYRLGKITCSYCGHTESRGNEEEMNDHIASEHPEENAKVLASSKAKA